MRSRYSIVSSAVLRWLTYNSKISCLYGPKSNPYELPGFIVTIIVVKQGIVVETHLLRIYEWYAQSPVRRCWCQKSNYSTSRFYY